MEYKSIFKSRKLRKVILSFFKFIPDKLMLKIQYKIKTGRRLNLKNPVRYTEKLQWYKLNYKNPIMHSCVDKYLVREFVKGKGLEHILVKLYAKYEKLGEINLDSLPDKFVIKSTNGSGGHNVILCNDKKLLNIEDVKKTLKNKKVKKRVGGREWAYYGLEPGIIVEELLVNRENPDAGVNDYKIFCYKGKAKYVIVDADRYIGHKRNIYDINWNNLNVVSDCPALDEEAVKPENYEGMIKIAEKLSEDFPYVRVDLYNISGKIYFGELTFYPWSGYVDFNPDSFDFEAGKDFELIKM